MSRNYSDKTEKGKEDEATHCLHSQDNEMGRINPHPGRQKSKLCRPTPSYHNHK